MPMFFCLYNLRQYTIFSIYPFFTSSVSKIIKFVSASVCTALGYPAWPILAAWLDPHAPVLLPAPIPIGNLAVKHPEVPLLPYYSVNPPSSFWESFPVCPLPPSSVSPVNAQALLLLLQNAPGLTAAQLARGRLSV